MEPIGNAYTLERGVVEGQVRDLQRNAEHAVEAGYARLEEIQAQVNYTLHCWREQGLDVPRSIPLRVSSPLRSFLTGLFGGVVA